MDKRSLEHSRSVSATYGKVSRHGDFNCLKYLDSIIEENASKLTIQNVGHIHKIFNRVNNDFADIAGIKTKSTREHAIQLFAEHYLQMIDAHINFEDSRIKTIMKNFVATKRKVFLQTEKKK